MEARRPSCEAEIVGPITFSVHKQGVVLRPGASVDAVVHLTVITVARIIAEGARGREAERAPAAEGAAVNANRMQLVGSGNELAWPHI